MFAPQAVAPVPSLDVLLDAWIARTLCQQRGKTLSDARRTGVRTDSGCLVTLRSDGAYVLVRR